MASIADIKISFSADLKKFSTDMQNAQRKMQKYGKQMQKVGKGLTLGVTAPVLGLGAVAVKAAADFETLNVSLDTIFKGNKEAAKAAFDQITEFTAKTPFQLEEVAGGFIKLKNLGLDPSIASLRSYGNTASALGKSLDQMVEAVADAAVGEFERLKEFGIKAKSQGDNVAFTFQGVTTTVKKNSEEIQEYLLGIGNTQFAGGIEKQANTFNGLMSTMKDNVKLAFAEFGVIIIEYLKPVLAYVQELVAWFKDLAPTTKKFIVIIAGIAAAIGPLLALAGTILPAIGTGLALLTGPIGLVVAGLTAVGVVIYKNWKPIKQTLVDIANYFVDLYNESTVFRVAVEGVVTSFKNVWATGKFVFSTLGNIISLMAKTVVTTFKNVGTVIKAALTGNFKEIPKLLEKNFTESQANFKAFAEELKKDFSSVKQEVTDNITGGIANALSGKKYKLLADAVDVDAVEEKVKNAVINGLVKGATGGQGNGLSKVAKVDTSGAGLAAIDTTITGGILDTFQTEALDEKALAFTERLLQFKEDTAEILAGAAQNFVGGFAEIIAGFANGTVGIGDVGKLLLNTMGNIAKQLGKAAIQIGLTMKALKLSFKTPGAAILAGVGLVALGALLKGVSKNFAGNFASGGIVGGNSFYGDRLTVGVNSGELILNLAQQNRIAGLLSGGGNIALLPSLRYEGDGFRVMLNRVDQKNDRRG